MTTFDTTIVTTIGDSAETPIDASQVQPDPATQRTNMTTQRESVNTSISSIREAADVARENPYSDEKKAEAEANGVDTRGWGIGSFFWNLFEGPFAREVGELMTSLEQKVSAVMTWLDNSNLSTLYDGPKTLIDASVRLGAARDASENAASHISDSNYKAKQLDAWVIADQTAYKDHRGIQSTALGQFADYCRAGEEQLGGYAMSLHVAYSAVSSLLANLALQIAQQTTNLISSLVERKFADAAKSAIEFVQAVLDAMQGVLDQATSLFTTQLNAARDLRENTIDDKFPGQAWPSRPPLT